jgi:glycosyltransferase involved in cell wall biosynthesis
MNFLILNSAKQWGGNENWIALLTTALSKLQHKVVIAYRSQKAGARFSATKIQLPFYSEADIITIYRLFRLIRRHRIDVIIATKQKEYFIGGLLGRLCHIPNILRLGIVRPLANSWSKKFIYEKWCDGIIVNALAIKETLLQSPFIQPAKICTVYNGVDIERIEKQSQQFSYKKPFSFMVISSGMLIKRKRFDKLLHAFALFKQATGSGDVGLLVLGAGEQLENLQALSRKLAIDGCTIFQGYQPNPFPYIKQGDCFVLMSENEGISNAMLEAMALKLPVISALSGGVAEVVKDGDNGFIINRESATELANRLQLLYGETVLRQKMGAKAYQTIQKQFSMDRMAQKISAFCSEIRPDNP